MEPWQQYQVNYTQGATDRWVAGFTQTSRWMFNWLLIAFIAFWVIGGAVVLYGHLTTGANDDTIVHHKCTVVFGVPYSEFGPDEPAQKLHQWADTGQPC